MPENQPTPLTAAEISQIVQLYKRGSTLIELAKRFDIHKRTVASHLEARGVERRINKRRMNDEQVQHAARMYASGLSLSKIGRRFTVNGSIVGCELRKLGIEIRPEGVRY